MSNTEVKWEKWEPVKIPDNGKRYIIQDFIFNSSKDIILLSNDTHLVKIEFTGYAVATRITEESERFGGESDMPPLYKTPLRNNEFIFSAENTDFSKWLKEETAGTIEELTHYFITDTYLIIDILAGTPTITVTEIEDVEKTSSDSEILEVSKSEFEEFQAWQEEMKRRERMK